MRIVAIFLISILSGCTLYQSDGRQAIEKNKADIVGAFGFDAVSKAHYSCFMSADLPQILQAPNHVIETEYEKQGFSSFGTFVDGSAQVVVYKLELDNERHHHCNLRLSESSLDSQNSAIRLAVVLLTEQISQHNF